VPGPGFLGTEWIIEAKGCAPAALRDLARMRGLCAEIVRELALIVVGEPQWHQFGGPGGVTGLYLLTESHLACHSYPELGVVTFNLYCCRPRARWAWEARLAEALGATQVAVRELGRDF
jgi:S-adenosylmethionine decarboxylase